MCGPAEDTLSLGPARESRVLGPLPPPATAPGLRPVVFPGDPNLSSIAAQHGCSLSAIALLYPFFVNDDFVTVLASAAARVRSADMIAAFRASLVRKPRPEEILLGVALGRRHTVYMDTTLLDHHEVLFCIEPPRGWIAASPDYLRLELAARTLPLPLPA